MTKGFKLKISIPAQQKANAAIVAGILLYAFQSSYSHGHVDRDAFIIAGVTAAASALHSPFAKSGAGSAPKGDDNA